MSGLEDQGDGTITLTLVRGDSEDFVVTLQDDDDPPNKIDLSKSVDGTASRPAVVRMAVKLAEDLDVTDNDDAVVFKVSHDDAEIDILAQTGATLGQFQVYIDKDDTEDAETDVPYQWDLEVTRQDFLKAAASVGTAVATAGSAVLVGSGTAFQNAKRGDVLQFTAGSNTVVPVIIEQVVSATQVRTSHDGWTTDSGRAFEIRRGKSRTVARGACVIESGVVGE